MLRIIVALALVAVAVPEAGAQQNRYTSWQQPGTDTGKGDVQTFVDRLNRLVDEAEKARAADPRFLRDLRDLANGFDRPWSKSVFEDSFTDGDFTANPAWNVVSGSYQIDRNWGLRSSGKGGGQGSSSSSTRLEGRDAAVAILGALLNGAAGNQGNQNQPAAASTDPEVIVARAPIANAFAIDLELSSWKAGGSFSVGVFQGDRPDNGYRLVYLPGQPLELHRVSTRRGVAIIERSASPVTLEDQNLHRLEWTRRGTGGAMRVLLDGSEVMQVSDVGFRDAFAGIALSNAGSDVIVRRIAVQAAP
jgi:hypothetical protein